MELNFSNAEQLVGKWFGENLYQRTFTFTNVSSANYTITNDWNSDYTILDLSGIAVETSGEIWCITPGNSSWNAKIKINGNSLIYDNDASMARVNLTIKYTK